MKTKWVKFAMLSAVLGTSSAMASDVDIGVSISGEFTPGVYGRVDIGNSWQPPLVYTQPVMVAAEPVWVSAEPIYLYVPPLHARHWHQYCYRYQACGRPVYFIRTVEYQPNVVYVYDGYNYYNHYHKPHHHKHRHESPVYYRGNDHHDREYNRYYERDKYYHKDGFYQDSQARQIRSDSAGHSFRREESQGRVFNSRPDSGRIEQRQEYRQGGKPSRQEFHQAPRQEVRGGGRDQGRIEARAHGQGRGDDRGQGRGDDRGHGRGER